MARSQMYEGTNVVEY